jgi:hypothetical protein
MTEPRSIKSLIGHDIHVDYFNGRRGQARGRLLNVNRRSLWLVADDEDRIIRLDDVVALRAAS